MFYSIFIYFKIWSDILLYVYMLNKIKNYINALNDENVKNEETIPDYHLIYKKILDNLYTDKDDSIYKINFVFYDIFKIQPENCENTAQLCNDRIGQTKFRNELVDFYHNCIISGDDSIICQACHILPYSKTKFNHVDNGLLLNYNLHHLYDSHLITFVFKENFDNIYDLYLFKISEQILNKKTFSNYKKYNNKIVKIRHGSKKFLDLNYGNFIK